VYIATRVYVSGRTARRWRLLQGLFPLCSFSGAAINWTWFAEDPFASSTGSASNFSARTQFPASRRVSRRRYFRVEAHRPPDPSRPLTVRH
jgi:hypothetical protein